MMTPSTMRSRSYQLAKILAYGWGMARAWVGLRIHTGHGSHRAIYIGKAPRFRNLGDIEIGRNFRTRGNQYPVSIETGPRGTLSIGDDVFINQGSSIYASTSVAIGNRVDIGDLVRIFDTNFHPTRPGESTKEAPVVIEDDVWIASGVYILPGVTIGRGSVVGAGAVVTKSVSSGSVVAGPVATVVRSFDVPQDYRRRHL